MNHPKKKVAMLVLNNCANDSRVIKQAETLASAGYKVRVFCVLNNNLPEYQLINNVEYMRVPIKRFFLGADIRALVKVTGAKQSFISYFLLPLYLLYKFCRRCLCILSSLARKTRPFVSALLSKIMLIKNNAAKKYRDLKSAAHRYKQSSALLSYARILSSLPRKGFRMLHGAGKEVTSFLKKKKKSANKQLREARAAFEKYFHLKFRRVLIFYVSFKSFQSSVVDWSPDIIHAHDLNTLPAAVKIASYNNAKVVYDAHELEEHRLPPYPGWMKRFIVKLEKKYLPAASKMMTVSDSISDYFYKKYGVHKPIVVYNSPNIAVSDKPESTVREDMGLTNDAPLIVFVGLAQMGRGIEEIFKSLTYLQDFHLALVGPKRPAYIESYSILAEKLGISDRIKFLDPVPSHHVTEYIASADIGILTLQNACLSYYYAMPNKLFEMALAGLPIVAGDLLDIKNFLQDTHLGIVVDEKNPEAIAFGIKDVFLKRDEFKPSNTKLAALIEKYAWPAQADKLIKLYQEIS